MRLSLVLGLVLAVSVPLGAQQSQRLPTGHPFVKYPQSQQSLARAVESGTNGDTSVMNISATDFVAVMNKKYNLRLENQHDLAIHIREMQVVPLPQDTLLNLTRLIGSKFDPKGWDRKAHENEFGLMNKETGVIELSLWCANPINGNLVWSGFKKVEAPKANLPPIAPMRVEKQEIPDPPTAKQDPPPLPKDKPAGAPRPTFQSGDTLNVNGNLRVSFEKSHWDRNWGWYTSVAIITTGLVLNNNKQWFRHPRDDLNITIIHQ